MTIDQSTSPYGGRDPVTAASVDSVGSAINQWVTGSRAFRHYRAACASDGGDHRKLACCGARNSRTATTTLARSDLGRAKNTPVMPRGRTT